MITGFQAGVMATGKPWTPREIATALWLDAADSSTITIGTGVSQWADKSGNSRHAVQNTGGNQPAYTANAQNNLSAVTFASPKWMALPWASFTGENYVFFGVVRVNNYLLDYPVSGTIVSSNGSSGTFMINSGNSTISIGKGGTNYSVSQNINNAGPHLFCSGFVGASAFSSVNGAAPNTITNFALPSATSGLVLGKLGTLGVMYLNGYIAELFVVPGYDTNSHQSKAAGYLAHKWGLTASLPSDHPYRYSPPTV